MRIVKQPRVFLEKHIIDGTTTGKEHRISLPRDIDHGKIANFCLTNTDASIALTLAYGITRHGTDYILGFINALAAGLSSPIDYPIYFRSGESLYLKLYSASGTPNSVIAFNGLIWEFSEV